MEETLLLVLFVRVLLLLLLHNIYLFIVCFCCSFLSLSNYVFFKDHGWTILQDAGYTTALITWYSYLCHLFFSFVPFPLVFLLISSLSTFVLLSLTLQRNGSESSCLLGLLKRLALQWSLPAGYSRYALGVSDEGQSWEKKEKSTRRREEEYKKRREGRYLHILSQAHQHCNS